MGDSIVFISAFICCECQIPLASNDVVDIGNLHGTGSITALKIYIDLNTDTIRLEGDIRGKVQSEIKESSE